MFQIIQDQCWAFTLEEDLSPYLLAILTVRLKMEIEGENMFIIKDEVIVDLVFSQ